MNTTSFSKPPTKIHEQITLLQSRGLEIKNIPEAEHYLTVVGYYRLAGYWQIYQDDREKHIFHKGTTFRHIKELYNMDREVRLLLFEALEKIEVGLRSIIVNTMSNAYGPFWISDPALAERNDLFESNLATIKSELSRSRLTEEFVGHYEKKYNNPLPPAWVICQILSFGTLSMLYKNIKNVLPEKKAIAKAVGLPNDLWLESWMLVFSVLRNYCAHHSRICYRTFTYPPKDLHKATLPWLSGLPPAGGRLREHFYYQLCAVRYILQSIDPKTMFTAQLKDLIKKYPSVSLRWMGFLPDWEKEDLWQ